MNWNSHLTAIARTALPVPVRWLLSQGMIHGHVLDYGCGKCKGLNDTVLVKAPSVKSVDSYDPHHAPDGIKEPNNHEGWYDVILCTYVLCTLPEGPELDILRQIRKNLRKNGIAFVTVRNDEPKKGYGISSRNTFQRRVELPYLYELRKTTQYRIYVLNRDTQLPII